ncbi:MAG: hypothetical protein R3A10_15055 [Caldilineaceae bacterium]
MVLLPATVALTILLVATPARLAVIQQSVDGADHQRLEFAQTVVLARADDARITSSPRVICPL